MLLSPMVLPLADLNLAGSPFLLRMGREADPALRESLGRVGMLCPPLVWREGHDEADDGPFVVVTGFARIEAWRGLGHEDVAVRVAPGSAAFEDLLALAVEEHRWSARGLNVIEQALALEKLAARWPRERLASDGMAMLGLRPSAERSERLLALRALPAGVQEALARGALAEAVVEHLQAFASEPFAPGDIESVARAIVALRMSLGDARDFARHAFEVCRRDGVAAEALLGELGLSECLRNCQELVAQPPSAVNPHQHVAQPPSAVSPHPHVAWPPTAVSPHPHVARPPSAVNPLEVSKSIVGRFTAEGSCATPLLGQASSVTPRLPGEVPAARARVLRALRIKRFPILTRLEQRHAERHRALGLPGGARIVPPRDFEGDGFRLEARVSSPEDLERLTRALDAALRERLDVVHDILNPSVET